ncbi:hypothetical protein NE237_026832 [Protea cynaroides]|uniref:Uncharacterized protein n=1 Tax=Protea cynaroides TaxID=273540 RepID=A0A9Q0JTK5_9MAGN|nr:hypothetical protein NE237_026832 [Protea cynaroides]
MEEILFNFNLMEILKKPAVVETFVNILVCVVPIWVIVMIGLLIGWSWRPSKFRFLWTVLPGFRACRLWLACTSLSTFGFGPISKGRGKSPPFLIRYLDQ